MAVKILAAKMELRKISELLSDIRSTYSDINQREAVLAAKLDGDGLTDDEIGKIESEVKQLEAESNENTVAARENAKAIGFTDISDDITTEELESKLTKRSEELKGIIADIEKRAAAAVSHSPSAGIAGTERRSRGEEKIMGEIRSGFFKGYNREEITNILKGEREQKFLNAIRAKENSISGTELTIPDTMRELLVDNLHKYSKLYKHVKVHKLKGKDRQNIMGAIPEAIWMEYTGTLNELKLSMTQIEMDGYKVGGYCIIPNTTLEDSDLNLAAIILENLSQSIAFALDKAIVYGTGVKMPKGIVTRLALTEEPSWWGKNQYAFTDLHERNIIKLTQSEAALTDAKFYSVLVERMGILKANYGGDGKFWVMNTRTYNRLMSKAVTVTAAGAITAQLNGAFPIIGGSIEILDFIPDGDIIGGYGTLYDLAERADIKMASSDQVKFIEEQTVYKATARYDGMPVFGEAFLAINIFGNDVTTSITFPQDIANAG